MSRFFPIAHNIRVNPNVELLAFHCGDAVFQLAHLAPGATFELHHHPESQMGMVLSGQLEMNINGTKEILAPLQHIYLADSHVPHGSINPFVETAVAFDVKKIAPSSFLKPDEAIFRLTPTIDQATNFPSQSACAPWFEVIITQIPAAEKILIQCSVNEQIGMLLNGQLVLGVGKEQQQLHPQEVYYVPDGTGYEVYNPSMETVTLIKILLSPAPSLAT